MGSVARVTMQRRSSSGRRRMPFSAGGGGRVGGSLVYVSWGESDMCWQRHSWSRRDGRVTIVILKVGFEAESVSVGVSVSLKCKSYAGQLDGDLRCGQIM